MYDLTSDEVWYEVFVVDPIYDNMGMEVVCPAVGTPGQFFTCVADIPRGSNLTFELKEQKIFSILRFRTSPLAPWPWLDWIVHVLANFLAGNFAAFSPPTFGAFSCRLFLAYIDFFSDIKSVQYRAGIVLNLILHLEVELKPGNKGMAGRELCAVL